MSELELDRHPNEATETRGQRLSDEEKEARKLHVNSSHIASLAGSIAHSMAVKDENVFFLSRPDSRVPLDGYHGFGLYFNDCRYLNGYELKMAGEYPSVLVASDEHGYMDLFNLANPALDLDDDHHLPGETIGIRIVRTIDGERQTFHEAIRFQNYGLEAVEIPITLTFKAEFEDIFAVRGLLQKRFGELHSPEWMDGVLTFSYKGADGLFRGLRIYFDPAPTRTEETTAHFDLKLGGKETSLLKAAFVVSEGPTREEALRDGHGARDANEIERVLKEASDEWLKGFTVVHSDSWILNRLLQRSIRDLRVLRSNLQGQQYFVAGLPWFGTLFGRDAAITALQMLAYDPSIAEQSLRLLVNYQADETDWWRDAKPGKFLHELRIGEMARIGEIPHYPYFGSVDATPLFLVLVARHAAWTGDLVLFEELRENIEVAFEWIDEYGDQNDDGYIEYDTKMTETRAGKRLINQGWKDSGDALINEDGSLAEPPIAVIEAQGYVYQAKMEMSELYRRAGETGRADELVREATDLRERFNRDFWLEEMGFYALALQAGNRPCAVVTSNPGHALWSGIIDPERAERVVERLMDDDMYSGWGIRTLSKNERAYNPLSYHRGTVWPWDNAIIAAGFYRYGFDEAAARIFNGMVDAARRFEDHRLPELFGGYDRDEYQIPVRYPVACHPQAWSAGTLPFLLQCLLGLQPDAFEGRLRIVRPYLPDMCDRLEMRGLRVGSALLDLRFERTEHGVAVQVLDQEGELEVIVEPSQAS
jgi:glycogen debranching enzyme